MAAVALPGGEETGASPASRSRRARRSTAPQAPTSPSRTSSSSTTTPRRRRQRMRRRMEGEGRREEGGSGGGAPAAQSGLARPPPAAALRRASGQWCSSTSDRGGLETGGEAAEASRRGQRLRGRCSWTWRTSRCPRSDRRPSQPAGDCCRQRRRRCRPPLPADPLAGGRGGSVGTASASCALLPAAACTVSRTPGVTTTPMLSSFCPAQAPPLPSVCC